MLALLTALSILAAVLFTVVLGAARVLWLPQPASQWGGLDLMLVLTFLVTGLAFVGVNGVLAYAVWRYRHRRDRRAHFFHDNPLLERSLIGVTALGIVVLLAPGLAVYAQVINPSEEAVRVEVVGVQWRWIYRYPGEDGVFGHASVKFVSPTNPLGLDPEDPAARDDIVVTGGPLYLPVGRPVQVQFRSLDVIHNFFVPNFRVKTDAVPGMVTRARFTPTQVGEYQAVCAELCGVGHWIMRGEVRVVPEAEFRAWLARQPRAGEALQ